MFFGALEKVLTTFLHLVGRPSQVPCPLPLSQERQEGAGLDRPADSDDWQEARPGDQELDGPIEAVPEHLPRQFH